MPRCARKILFAGLLLICAGSALAVVDVHDFSSEEIRERYHALTEELRCPKCQNQNLAGSDSSVSEDLRREILLMLEEGHSDAEIRSFMRERYGDFILYNPPVEGKTLLVWVIPPLFLFFGVLVVVLVVRSASRNAARGVPDEFETSDPEHDNPPDDGSTDR